MAVFKGDVKRITISVPKIFAEDLDKHLKNFALTDKSRWFLEAGKEKMAQEKLMLSEREEEEYDEEGKQQKMT
ncbi:MAG UNVERIFIED_CONTAM: hypothetical protein LVQ98_08595 [Rickettsiaceae bacterium]|jgi:metal-responsive CopG/Arc/MetJ family transcriptional regulator